MKSYSKNHVLNIQNKYNEKKKNKIKLIENLLTEDITQKEKERKSKKEKSANARNE